MNDDGTIVIYDYSLTQRWACPDCYRPVSPPRRGKDGRCTRCRRSVRLVEIPREL